MLSEATYVCKCEQCKREIYDMMSQVPPTHITVDFTVNNNETIEQHHKRFCDLICLKEWITRALPLGT